MYVSNRFVLKSDILQSLTPRFGYNGFGELTFYRTYSRQKKDGSQETWADVVTRVTNGTFSIRKDFYIKNRIGWDEDYWQEYAIGFAESMFRMKWLPPGRGLWAMGSDFIYERGAMALYNCAYTSLTAENFSEDIGWLMDSLMNGVGVGFGPLRDGIKLQNYKGHYDFVIPDTREGWVEVVVRTLEAYLKGGPLPDPVYDYVRPAGMLIKGFGGIASGPDPLKKLVQQIINQCEMFLAGELDEVEFKTNVANLVGCCVVAGNVRRSAEIACGSVHDQVFMNLKNYSIYPDRAAWGWMSNNSVLLEQDEDFDHLGEIAKRVASNGEPGVINLRNVKHGRIGRPTFRIDRAIGFNPCGEIPLEHREVCNLSETLPTMCDGPDDWYRSCEYATCYSSTVSLLPTHQQSTNKVVARNRRIGVGIIDFTGWKVKEGVYNVTRFLRNGYDVVTETNVHLNQEAGVPEAIRKTTVKPGGTTPKLPGKTSGAGHPTFKYTLRRIRVAKNAPIHPILANANIPYEKDHYSDNTDVFEYPIIQGPAKPATQVSLWEQANNIVLLQREWSDNAVSNTLYFKPKWPVVQVAEGESGKELAIRHLGIGGWDHLLEKGIITVGDYRFVKEYDTVKMLMFDYNHEEDDIEPVLSSIIPLVKSISLLPHTPNGVYVQMPEEGICEDEYEGRLAAIDPIDWTLFKGSDGMDEKFCSGATCERPSN